ncbi:MAG: hypothetical protein IT376_05215 [Polyangiaceae bacterium]|nr:hypothetical protein [Polyangiaceae bacterium]
MKLAAALVLVVAPPVGVACESSRSGTRRAAASAEPAPSTEPARAAPRPPAPLASPGHAAAAIASGASASVAPAAASSARAAPGAPRGAWRLSDVADLGPAAPAAATPTGIVAITATGEIVRVDAPSVAAAAARPTPRFGADAAFARGRAPAVVAGHAYRVAGGQLVRAPLAGGPQQELAAGARDGTRVAVALDGDAPVVAWIAEGPGETLTARLWRGGAGIAASPDGAGASSVALVRGAGGLLLLALDVRTGMTQLHAARVVADASSARVEGDAVLWVGGAGGSYTEVAAASDGRSVTAWVAMERGVSGFGLATIEVGERPRVDAPSWWREYPNGLDPAPVAGAPACGAVLVAFVQPTAAAPGAERALLLADARGGDADEVARARTFGDVSVAPTHDGALLVWVAGDRTWARSLRCAPGR